MATGTRAFGPGLTPNGRWRWCCALTIAGFCLTGCSKLIDWSKRPKEVDQPTAASAPPGPLQVRVDSFGKPLSEGQEATVTGAAFLEQVDRLLAQERRGSLRAYIERFPDVALETLRSTKSADAARPAVRFVAETYDRQVLTTPGDGWTATLDRRAKAPRQYAALETARADLLERIRLGRGHEAANTKLVEHAEELRDPQLLVDAAHLQSIALMLDERPAEAAAIVDRALHTVAAYDAVQAAQLQLVASDLLRRTGDGAGADRRWQLAVDLAAQQLQRSRAVFDPSFWERASYLRPVNQPWSAAVASLHLARLGVAGPGESTLWPAAESEAAVWGAIGAARAERGETQSALLALKRAESGTGRESLQERLRLLQAITLFRMDQATAATAILVAQSSKPNPSVARPALATLGAQKLQAGDAIAGYRLLNKAFEQPELIDWPERGQAEADLGLVYLMRGEQATGLRHCHAAQTRFQADHDVESLAKSLANEVKFYEHVGNKAEAARVRARLGEVER